MKLSSPIVVPRRLSMPYVPAHPPHTRAHVAKLHPGLGNVVIDPLAAIWDEVVYPIVGTMTEMAPDDGSLHINDREEMILELAKLQLHIGEAVTRRRIGDRHPSTIDPVIERTECFSAAGERLIEGTARVFHDRVWSRLLNERWRPKSRAALDREENPTPRRVSLKPVGKNHFIPLWFIRDHWSFDGRITRWRRDADGWSSRRRGFHEWGFRHNLYSDAIEAYLGLIEGDAKRPIQMLLATEPLNQPQRLALVAFLVVQILRSPFLIERLEQQLVPLLSELGGEGEAVTVREAYDALYTSDALDRLAHPFMWSRWALVTTSSPVVVLPDTFGARADLGDGLRMIAPLTPYVCFVTMPGREEDKRIVPVHHHADEFLSARISSVLRRSAVNEFLSHPGYVMNRMDGNATVEDVIAEIQSAVT